MEACASAHYWGREVQALGHKVKLVPPIYVKPFVKRHKNDTADAEAITEAAQRPTMNFVAVKTEEQQARGMLTPTGAGTAASCWRAARTVAVGWKLEWADTAVSWVARIGRIATTREACSARDRNIGCYSARNLDPSVCAQSLGPTRAIAPSLFPRRRHTYRRQDARPARLAPSSHPAPRRGQAWP